MADTLALPTDFKIYDELAQTAYIEHLQDNLQVFNENSAGAIILNSEAIIGDKSRAAFNVPAGGISHRNINSNATVDVSKIEGAEKVGIKTDWKFGPFGTTLEAFRRRGLDVSQFYSLMGQQLAENTMKYMAEASFKALTGAIGSNASMQANGAIGGKQGLINGMRKFGDKFANISVFAMNSGIYFDLVEGAIADQIYNEAGVVVYGGTPGTMGKPVLVTDVIKEDAAFALQGGAVSITETAAPAVRSWEVNNLENLGLGYRAEGSFLVDVLGYNWKDDAGNSPSLANLEKAAKWAKVAADNKATAGVFVTFDGQEEEQCPYPKP